MKQWHDPDITMNFETPQVVFSKHSGTSFESLEAVNEIFSCLGMTQRYTTVGEADLTPMENQRALELYWPVNDQRTRIGWIIQNTRSLNWAWYVDQRLRCKRSLRTVEVVSPTVEKQAAVPAKKAVDVKRPPERSLTYIWIETQMREQALDRRIASILKKKNLEDYEELHSTTCLWLAEWANAGTFDAFLAEGKPPSAPTLAKWVGQKLYHDRYKNGTDALTRQMTGARTQCEVRHIRTAVEASERDGSPMRPFLMPGAQKIDPAAPKAIMNPTRNDQPSVEGGFDLVDPKSASLFIEDREKSAEHALVRDIIRVRRPRAADRYGRMFDYIISGTPKEQVAEKEGIALLRVSHLFQRVRDDMTGAPVLVDVALRILALVTEEPWAELAEIEAEFSKNPEVVPAIQLLKVRGLLEERNASFAVTQAGRSAAQVGLLA